MQHNIINVFQLHVPTKLSTLIRIQILKHNYFYKHSKLQNSLTKKQGISKLLSILNQLTHYYNFFQQTSGVIIFE